MALADVAILDLEDAVAPKDKTEARATALRQGLRSINSVIGLLQTTMRGFRHCVHRTGVHCDGR